MGYRKNKMYHKIEDLKGEKGKQDVYGLALPYRAIYQHDINPPPTKAHASPANAMA